MRIEWNNACDILRDRLSAAFPKILSDNIGEDELGSHFAETEIGSFGSIRFNRLELRPKLFDYQQDLVDQISSLRERHALLALPTGAGKTRTAVTATLEGIATGTLHRVAWLAPSIELVDQAFATFADLSLYQGNLSVLELTREPTFENGYPAVLLTTPQTVYSRRNDNRYAINWDMVIFDEAHQLGAPTYRDAIQALGIAVGRAPDANTAPILLGLSATPGRSDPDEIEDFASIFDGVLLKSKALGINPVSALQKSGVLADLRFKRLTRSTVPTDDEARRLKIAANACAELTRRGRRVLAFTATVPGAIVLAQALRSVDVPASAVHSDTPLPSRRAILSEFASGHLSVLTNQRLLATGYDCPAVSDVLILSRIGSPILFEQIVGRAARGPKTGGSRTATIWDFDDHLSLHGRPSSYYRYLDYYWT